MSVVPVAPVAAQRAAASPVDFSPLLRSLFDRSGIGLAVLDCRLHVVDSNAVFAGWHGGTERNFCELLHPSIRHHLGRQLARVVRGQIRCVERVAARWADEDSGAGGELTGMAIDREPGQPRSVAVLVSPGRGAPSGRHLIGSTKLLTNLDARILEGVAMGMTTIQLAAKLYLSRQGVEYHIGTMLRKFNVPNRAALASKAFSAGVFRIGCWPPEVVPDHVVC
jgi:DNA-binding CsgD family transcriptional regulator